MHPRDIKIEDFTYELPDERIAKYPLAERDASKLLIYKNSNIVEDSYRNLAAHIPADTLMVFNQTKVVHARLLFTKPSGGVIEVFCLAPHSRYADIQTAMLQKGGVEWECLIGGASKWKHGMVLQLPHKDPDFILSARITERGTGSYIVSLEWDSDLTFAEILHHAGKVPLPPYLHRDADATDETRYQTLFAKDEGSVAAPTAALHFTDNIMRALANKNIHPAFVTLHVGAGTFRPVKSDTMEGHDMHAEWIEVSLQFVNTLIGQLQRSGTVIPVGTTSLRTIESLYWVGNKLLNNSAVDIAGIAVSQWDPYEGIQQHATVDALQAMSAYMEQHSMTRLITRTQILIAPGYKMKIANAIVTNFHQPQSTLLLLIAAFTGMQWRDIYSYALSHNFRFLSYGDGSLLWLS
jgi:S-adenosylmethionine:tRNA ribosyltransferase-isomerase